VPRRGADCGAKLNSELMTYTVGTSGYSFDDWVGTFYPPGTRKAEMFDRYIERFETVEVNYTYYRMPTLKTMEDQGERGRDAQAEPVSGSGVS